jgi:hypothetical protein
MSNHNKIYLAISTQNEKKNINELTSVWYSFDGICAVDHFSNDGTYEILKSRCKDGFVEQIPYYGHHSHDLNHILFNPKIKIGDWILLRDSSERVDNNFAFNIRPFIKILEQQGVNSVYQRSKILMFRRFPHQCFSSTPHWGLQGAQSKIMAIEKQLNLFHDDKEYCYSVRDEIRDKYHFVDAFMRYYLIIDSNHNLLGLENFGDPNELFPKLEKQRISFLDLLNSIGVNNDINSLKLYLLSNREVLSDVFKDFINNNLILNQFYRYHVLDDKTVSPDIAAPIVKI